MAGRESLENLIEGLAGAVVEAQRRIEWHQIDNLKSFFDKDTLRPQTLEIRVPSLHPLAGEKDDVIYRVPLLPIVASSLLRIKEVEISFDADLVGLADDEEAEKEQKKGEGTEAGTRGTEKKKSVSIDIRGGIFRRNAGKAHVILKVEGRELSEGMARLVDRLVQVQGEVEIKRSQD